MSRARKAIRATITCPAWLAMWIMALMLYVFGRDETAMRLDRAALKLSGIA